MATDQAKGTCFVIAPIGDDGSPERIRSDQVLKYIIEPVVDSIGYVALRADQISKSGSITNQVIEHLIDDALVIADLTGHNPNVFYELALRHAIRKPVVLIIEEGEDIPFDIKTERTIFFNHTDLASVDRCKNALTAQIKAVGSDPRDVDNPITLPWM